MCFLTLKFEIAVKIPYTWQYWESIYSATLFIKIPYNSWTNQSPGKLYKIPYCYDVNVQYVEIPYLSSLYVVFWNYSLSRVYFL